MRSILLLSLFVSSVAFADVAPKSGCKSDSLGDAAVFAPAIGILVAASMIRRK